MPRRACMGRLLKAIAGESKSEHRAICPPRLCTFLQSARISGAITRTGTRWGNLPPPPLSAAAVGGDPGAMIAQAPARWSGGVGSTPKWFWTAAAVTAVITVTTVTATTVTTPTDTDACASAIASKPDAAAATTTTGTKAKAKSPPPASLATTLGGCDCGCGGQLTRGSGGGINNKGGHTGAGTTPSFSSSASGLVSAIPSAVPAEAVPAEAVPAVAASPAAEGSAELSFVFKDYALRHTETSKARSSFGACVGTSASSSSDSVIVNRGGYPGPGVGGVRLDAAVLGRRGSGGEWGQDWSVGKDVPLAGRPLFTSVTSFKGYRPCMEDEFFLSRDGSFSAVYDGHRGPNVSMYLRRNLYRHFMENLPPEGHDAYELSTVERALREAFKSADDYVTRQTPYCNEGSCAVSVTVHCDREGKASIISCNVGDSRAVLSRGGKAFDLTEDHKPNSPKELERIHRHDGTVTWDGLECPQGMQIEGTGVHRINGNLAVARAIGDVDCRPWVSGEAEIRTIEVNRETDQFVILASNGLWDVMTSEEAVQYVHSVMGRAVGTVREKNEERISAAAGETGSGAGRGSGPVTVVDWTQSRAKDRLKIRAATMLHKKKMALYLTAEALKRGSMDNTTVAVVWLN